MNKKIIVSVILITAVGGAILLFNTLKKPQSPNQTTNSVPTQTASPTQQNIQTYTVADVAQHNDKSSCWTTINGKVYDLTSFVGHHPGGSMRILSICGTDGSQAFNGQHGTKSRPNNELESLYIGNLL